MTHFTLTHFTLTGNFIDAIRTKKALHITFVSPYGLTKFLHSGIAMNEYAWENPLTQTYELVLVLYFCVYARVTEVGLQFIL